MSKRVFVILVCIVSAVLLSSCGKAEEKAKDYPYQVYCLSNDGLSLKAVGYAPEASSQEMILKELLGQLQISGEDYTAPISGTVSYSNMSFEDHTVTVTFSSYSVEDSVKNILIRAAIVRTLSQVDGVFNVAFQVSQDASNLSAIAPVIRVVYSADYFVMDIGEPSEPIMMRLYFPSTSGDGVKEVERPVIFDDFKSREQYLMEILIAGPTKAETGALAGIPASTKILSVSTKNRICTVNLSKEFTKEKTDAAAKLIIQSIAYTLIRNLEYVDGVSFYLEGKPLTTFRTYEVSSVIYENEEKPSENKQ